MKLWIKHLVWPSMVIATKTPPINTKGKNVYLLSPREVDYMGFNLLMLDIAAITSKINK